MKQEDKELLLKDLCARLNTNLVCSIYRIDDQGIGYRNEILYGYCNIDRWNEFYFGEDCGISIDDVSKIKPYLFPLSSMTDKELTEFLQIKGMNLNSDELKTFRRGETAIVSTLSSYSRHIDWLNAHHFDYRGLIDKSLALDATGLNIYKL